MATPAAPASSQSLAKRLARPSLKPSRGEHCAYSPGPALANGAEPSTVSRPSVGRTRRSLPASTSKKNGDDLTLAIAGATWVMTAGAGSTSAAGGGVAIGAGG